MNHNHSCSCSHESVKFCSHCNTVYCEGCNQEWTVKSSWYYYQYPINQTSYYNQYQQQQNMRVEPNTYVTVGTSSNSSCHKQSS